MTRCEICGEKAYHFPVNLNGEAYCCLCYNNEIPCPDEYCDSHNN